MGLKIEVEKGVPERNGVYLVYTAKSEATVFPTKTVLMWEGGQWWQQEQDKPFSLMVLGWIGPLPAPSVDDFLSE